MACDRLSHAEGAAVRAGLLCSISFLPCLHPRTTSTQIVPQHHRFLTHLLPARRLLHAQQFFRSQVSQAPSANTRYSGHCFIPTTSHELRLHTTLSQDCELATHSPVGFGESITRACVTAVLTDTQDLHFRSFSLYTSQPSDLLTQPQGTIRHEAQSRR